jgi:hypothetical protein
MTNYKITISPYKNAAGQERVAVDIDDGHVEFVPQITFPTVADLDHFIYALKQASFEYQVNAAGQERWIQHNDIHVHSCHECPHWQDSDEGPRCEYPDYPPCND